MFAFFILIKDEGILYKKRGIGMFVSKGARNRVVRKRQTSFLKDTLPEVIIEANRLEITLDELIQHIKDLGEGSRC